jgi:glycosyltransferase involved in cell wall biosynthesis
MRILHFISTVAAASGGPAEGLQQYCSIYKAGGHEVEVASLDAPEVAKKSAIPAPVIGLGPGSGVYGYSPLAVPWLKANPSRFDLVIINGVWQYNAVAAYCGLKGTGIPYAVFTHGMLDPYFKRSFPLKHIKKTFYWHAILKKILCNANAVLFTSEEEKLLARESFPGYHVRETVVPYGSFGPKCDLAGAADEFIGRWPELSGKRLALSLGRIHPKKGTDMLIEAFAATLAKDPQWHLVLAGPDQIGWQKELETIAANLGIAHRITWTGMLRDTLKWGAFAASEVFVLPSHQENFGIVVAEAQSCGLPVILSSRINIWREVASYWAGLINEDSLDGTIASLQRWSELTGEEIADVSKRSRKCFNELFDFDSTSRKVLGIVEQLAQSRPGGIQGEPSALSESSLT